MKKLIFLFVLAFSIQNTFAQKIVNRPTIDNDQLLKDTKVIITDLGIWFNEIAKGEIKEDLAAKMVLKYFAENAKIEVSNKTNKNLYSVKEYISLLRKYRIKFSFVDIEFVDVTTSNYRQVGKDKNGNDIYRIDFSYLQKFVAYKCKDNIIVYTNSEVNNSDCIKIEDMTLKTGSIDFKIITDSMGSNYQLLIKDISVLNTKTF